MAEDLGVSVLRLTTDSSGLNKGIDEAHGKSLNFGLAFGGVMLGAAAAIDVAQKAFGAFVSVFDATIGKTLEHRDHIRDLSQQTGLATETLSGLDLQARLNGTSLETMVGGFRALSSLISDAAGGSESATKKFSALGISTKALSETGGDLEKAYRLVLDRFKAMPESAEKNALAVDLFGRSGLQFKETLNQGTTGLDAHIKKTKDFHTAVTNEGGEAADGFKDQVTLLNESMAGFSSELTDKLVPMFSGALEAIIDQLEKFKAYIRDMDPETKKNLEALGKSFAELGKAIVEVFAALAPIITPLIEGLVWLLNSRLVSMASNLRTVLDDIKGVFAIFKDAITGNWMKLWDDIYNYVARKIGDVKKMVSDFTGGVTGFFGTMYDKVVGHSFVPDMIDGIAREFGRLGKVMVGPTDAATKAVEGKFAGMLANVSGRISSALSEIGGLVGSNSGVGKGISAAQHGLNALGQFATGNIVGGVIESIRALKDAFKAIGSIGHGRETADEFVKKIQNPFGELLGRIASTGTLKDLDFAVDSFNEDASQFARKDETAAKVVGQAHDTLDPMIRRVRNDLTNAGRTGDTNVNVYTQPSQDAHQIAVTVLREIQIDAALRADFNAQWSPA